MRPLAATIATVVSLLSGAQALAPATAMAADDETWCFRIVNGSVQFVNECEGAGSGEVIVVVGQKPTEPNRPTSGPGFDRGTGGDSSGPSAGARSGGRRTPSMGAPSRSPGQLKEDVERCEKVYDEIETLHRKRRTAGPDGEIGEMVQLRRRDVARGTMVQWKWVTLTPEEVTNRLQRLTRETKEGRCAKIAPIGVYF